MAPDKIFLEKERETNKISHLWGVSPVLHSGYEHIEYIRKDSLLEWAKEMLHKVEVKSNDGDVFAQGMHAGFGATISKIYNL